MGGLFTGGLMLGCSDQSSKDASAPRQEQSLGIRPGSTSMSLKGQSSVSGGAKKRSRAADKLADDQDTIKEETKTRGKGGKKRRGLMLLRPFDKASGRYLEYTVNLSYKTKDLEKSRKLLLDVVSKYGFVKSSRASAAGDVPYMNAGIHLKAEDLYAALKELDALGELKSANMRSTDHTENMFWRGIQMRREALRLRRKAGFGRIAPTSKNWVHRNRSLEQSENNEDKARFERWKMRDRTSWAKVTVNLSGPDLPAAVRVPNYRKALVGLVNMALGISYGLVWLSPLFVLIGLVVMVIRKRKAIFGRFKKKPEANE